MWCYLVKSYIHHKCLDICIFFMTLCNLVILTIVCESHDSILLDFKNANFQAIIASNESISTWNLPFFIPCMLRNSWCVLNTTFLSSNKLIIIKNLSTQKLIRVVIVYYHSWIRSLIFVNGIKHAHVWYYTLSTAQ